MWNLKQNKKKKQLEDKVQVQIANGSRIKFQKSCLCVQLSRHQEGKYIIENILFWRE